MADSNITKLALANSLKELMGEKSFSRISVNDIVENCGLTRPSFYYHFKDKYDLMNWIYYTETARLMLNYDSIEHWTDGIRDLCYYMMKNRSFYINALNTTGQNSFPEYLEIYIKTISKNVIENSLQTSFDQKKWGMTVELVSIALVGLIIKWANNGMKDDPAEYIALVKSIVDGSLLSELKENELQQ